MLACPWWYRDSSACLHLKFSKTINICMWWGSLLCVSSCDYPCILASDTAIPDRSQGWLDYRLLWLLMLVVLLLPIHSLQVLLRRAQQGGVRSDLTWCLLLCPRHCRSCCSGYICPALVLCRRNSILLLLQTFSWLVASTIKCRPTRSVSRCRGLLESSLWSFSSLLCRVITSTDLTCHRTWLLWSERTIYTRSRWHIWALPFNLELSSSVPLHLSHGSRMATLLSFRNIPSPNVYWFLTRG